MENDVLGRWLAEACISEPGTTALWTPARDLYASFQSFAQAEGEAFISQKAFGDRLRQRGFQRKKLHVGAGWYGLRLVDGERSEEQGAGRPAAATEFGEAPDDMFLH